MNKLQRFDLDGAKPLTEREIRRRWADFHNEIHAASGNRFQQIAGRLLGENTRRYKVARFFGRPIIRLLRGPRPSAGEVAPVTVVLDLATAFPANYFPRVLAPGRSRGALEPQLGSVAIVTITETNDSPAAIITSLNESITSARATWLFVADASASSFEQAATVAALLNHAIDEDDVVFADETGPNHLTPILKSRSVGPHTLLSYNVVGRPALLRLSTLQQFGGFSPTAGWAFEHDFYLRVSEAKGHFHHVPVVLPAARPTIAFSQVHINDDTCRVVETALERRGLRGTVAPSALGGLVKWTLDAPSPQPSVDIIIPTRDRVELVQQCIEAIEEKTTYTNYDIIILDNDSEDPATLEYFASTKYRVVPCPGPFNYAHIVNRGIDHSTADFVLTLNNDTVVITPDWLERLVSLASLPDVGIVGACLFDRDGRREHESIVIAPYPQHLRSDSNYPHADHFIGAIRDVAAVTGAVQMVRREFWQSLNGMDEDLKVVMNDVDICLRSQLEGRYVVYTPDVHLYHHVGSSRGSLDPLDDRNRFILRWDIFGSFQDPYFPESLLLLGETIYYRPR